MKHYFLFTFLSFLGFVTAQEINTDIKNYTDLESKTTYFINTGDEKFNADLKKQLIDHWKFTKIEFINSTELNQFEGKENKEKIEQSYFLTFGDYIYKRPANQSKLIDIENLRLTLYKDLKIKKKYFEVENLLAEVKLEKNRPDQLIFATQLINNQLEFAVEMDLTSDLTFKELLQELSKENKYLLKDYTLFVNTDLLADDISTEAVFKEFYDYPFQFTDKYIIRQNIENQLENAAYLKIVNYSGVNYVTFYTAKNAKILFSFIMRGPNQEEIRKHFFKKALRD